MHIYWVDDANSPIIGAGDRGLQYGDGVFETMAVIDGQIPLWQLHAERLQVGCQCLRLPAPPMTELESQMMSRIKDLPRAILKLILTRGVGGRGYALPHSVETSLIMQLHPWPDSPGQYWTHGVKVRFCELRLARQPALAGIKHLNRLEQVLARAEWSGAEFQEGLLTDTSGDVIEAISHNLFAVHGEQISTPDLKNCGVDGVMRRHIIAMLRHQGRDVRVTRLDRHALSTADALFLCNSIHGIWPVRELDDRHYPENRLICDLREQVAERVPY